MFNGGHGQDYGTIYWNVQEGQVLVADESKIPERFEHDSHACVNDGAKGMFTATARRCSQVSCALLLATCGPIYMQYRELAQMHVWMFNGVYFHARYASLEGKEI